jgi:hypothetical protein
LTAFNVRERGYFREQFKEKDTETRGRIGGVGR